MGEPAGHPLQSSRNAPSVPIVPPAPSTTALKSQTPDPSQPTGPAAPRQSPISNLKSTPPGPPASPGPTLPRSSASAPPAAAPVPSAAPHRPPLLNSAIANPAPRSAPPATPASAPTPTAASRIPAAALLPATPLQSPTANLQSTAAADSAHWTATPITPAASPAPPAAAPRAAAPVPAPAPPAEQRVLLAFRDRDGTLRRVISQPETWQARGHELLPGWRHASLANVASAAGTPSPAVATDAANATNLATTATTAELAQHDRQELPTPGTFADADPLPTGTTGENLAGSNPEHRNPSRDEAPVEKSPRGDERGEERGRQPAVRPVPTALRPTDAPSATPPTPMGFLAARAAAEPIPAARPRREDAGTSIAPTISNMNTADAGNQTNLREQPNLPLVAGLAGLAGNPETPALPGQWKVRRAARPFPTDLTGPADLTAPWAPRVPLDPHAAALAAAPPLPEHPQVSVDKVMNLISRELTLVRQLGADALAIVLKPDSRTELFLQISQRNGRTEALIRCERGDFQHLELNWAQLQSTLAGQDVALAPLQRSTLAPQELTDPARTATGTGSGNGGTHTGTGHQPQQHSEPPPRFREERSLAAASTAPGPRRSGGTATRTTPKSGLERWA